MSVIVRRHLYSVQIKLGPNAILVKRNFDGVKIAGDPISEDDVQTAEPAEPRREARYHHGDLRAALLQAGEHELAEKGPAGFTLRGTAKRAGVSHAAPAHHFRDANALLSALAARGFERLKAAMDAAQAAAAPDPQAQLVASGIGYFRFGMENPALLQLMFGPRRAGDEDPELLRTGGAAFEVLIGNVSAYMCLSALEHAAGRTAVAAAWSIVHGFTMLALQGRLSFLGEPRRATLEDELEAILSSALPPLPCGKSVPVVG